MGEESLLQTLRFAQSDNLSLNKQPLLLELDLNITSAAKAQERGASILRKQEVQAKRAQVITPPNCGAELFDVVTVSDKRCQLTSQKYRVTAIQLAYNTRVRAYYHRLTLGTV